MTDSELIEFIRQNNVKGSDLAMRQIYKECYPMTENLVLKNSGNMADAKDIFQEAMVVFYYKVKEDDFQLSSKISTYIYSISKNQWYKKIRANKKKIEVEMPEYLEVESNLKIVPSQKEYNESQIALAELLQKSGEKCVKLLRAFYIENLSMLKIAKILDYSSEQVAKNKKARCLKKIRAVMLQNKEYQEKLANIF